MRANSDLVLFFEPDETFFLRLANPSPGLLLGPSQAAITIRGRGLF